MKFILDNKVTWLALTLVVLLLMPQVSQAAEDNWISEVTTEMLAFQAKGWGNFQPYLHQIQVVRIALRKGDNAAAHMAMKRFTDMLENRENRIAAPVADWLLDFCYKVMPVKFREASRYFDTRKM